MRSEWIGLQPLVVDVSAAVLSLVRISSYASVRRSSPAVVDALKSCVGLGDRDQRTVITLGLASLAMAWASRSSRTSARSAPAPSCSCTTKWPMIVPGGSAAVGSAAAADPVVVGPLAAESLGVSLSQKIAPDVRSSSRGFLWAARPAICFRMRHSSEGILSCRH